MVCLSIEDVQSHEDKLITGVDEFDRLIKRFLIYSILVAIANLEWNYQLTRRMLLLP